MTTEQEKRIKDYHDQCFMNEFLHKFAEAAGQQKPFIPKHISEVKNIREPKSIGFMNNLTSRNAQKLFSQMPKGMSGEIEP